MTDCFPSAYRMRCKWTSGWDFGVSSESWGRGWLREDGDHFTASTASKNDALQAFGEHFNELHVVGLTSWRHLARNARHVENDQLCCVAFVDDVLVEPNCSVPAVCRYHRVEKEKCVHRQYLIIANQPFGGRWHNTHIRRTFNSSGLMESPALMTDSSLPNDCNTWVRCSISTVRSYVYALTSSEFGQSEKRKKGRKRERGNTLKVINVQVIKRNDYQCHSSRWPPRWLQFASGRETSPDPSSSAPSYLPVEQL